jgi:uncharacterized protein
MRVQVNIRHLEHNNVQLKGELPAEDLDIDTRDEAIRLKAPLRYDLEVQRVEQGLLVQGALALKLDCSCVRCLQACEPEVALPHWARHLPLEGDDAVPVVNDVVDLTPFLREDMLLEFPQHPLCHPDCGGLPRMYVGKPKNTPSGPDNGSSA